MGFGAAFGQGSGVAEREVGVGKGQPGEGGGGGFGEGVAAGTEGDRDAGFADDIEVAVEAADVDAELSGERVAVFWGFGEDLDEAVESDEALRRDGGAIGGLGGTGARSTLFGHRILTVKTTPLGVLSCQRLRGGKPLVGNSRLRSPLPAGSRRGPSPHLKWYGGKGLNASCVLPAGIPYTSRDEPPGFIPAGRSAGINPAARPH